MINLSYYGLVQALRMPNHSQLLTFLHVNSNVNRLNPSQGKALINLINFILLFLY